MLHRPMKYPTGESLPVRSRTTRPGAFTIIELLLVIAVVVILLAIATVSVQGLRQSAFRTDSVNTLRLMGAAYNTYMTDHNQRLMPGYVDPDDIEDGTMRIDGRLPDKRWILADVGDFYEDVSSYVWRLSPYLDDGWQTLYRDYRNASLIARMDQELSDEMFGPASAGEDYIGISYAPAYGLNSIFVGGDSLHGGNSVAARAPWLNPGTPLAATRFTQVRSPSQLIIFGPTGRANPGADSGSADPDEVYAQRLFNSWAGYMELRAPYIQESTVGDFTSWTNQQWTVGRGGLVEATATGEYNPAGLPIARWGAGRYPVVNLDGSATIEDLTEISSDMRRWSPFVTGIDAPGVQ